MIGDISDMVRRLRSMLPAGWFADDAPYLQSLLSGFGVAWSAIYNLVMTVRAQTRIATASGIFLDQIATDFFGDELARLAGEADDAFRLRIHQETLRPRATRSALARALSDLTGRAPVIFEPTRPADTGGYNLGGVGYCVAGGWGNLGLPFQFFVTTYRPLGKGIAWIAGYGSGGVLGYTSLSMVSTGAADADIYRCVAQLIPVASTAWTRITN